MENLIEVTDNSFDAQVLKCDIPVLTFFSADWSAPARKMRSILAELTPGYEDRLKIVELDIEANPVVTSEYAVLNVPTLVLVKRGMEVERMSGLVSKEKLLEKVTPFLDE
jgi:thioredoxin 1